jgi:hypothetical protein
MIRRTLCALALVGGAAACNGGVDNPDPGDDSSTGDDTTTPPLDEWDQQLEERVVDYSTALRTAALKLTGDLPTMDEIHAVADAADEAAKKLAYETLIDAYMARPSFAVEVFHWWQDTLKSGDAPDLDQAAAFAAQVTVEGRSFDQLLTATTGACGSFDVATATFTPADCANGVPIHAGLLTHPGIMRHYNSNFGFRRAKWVQETFVCTKFPAEVNPTPVEVGGAAPYTGVQAFESVPDLTTGRVNFRDTSAVICANCHSTMNHFAPLFAYFDDAGQLQPNIAVLTPLEGAPPAELTDYLVAGETYQWRLGVQTPDLPALGAAIAADPDVSECAIARIWNWALNKGDIVDALREVPPEVIQAQVDAYNANSKNLKAAIAAIFKSSDFVRY